MKEKKGRVLPPIPPVKDKPSSYIVDRQQKQSVAALVLSRLKSKKEMVMIKEILDPPLSMRGDYERHR
jgi:hypothetical protein